MDYKLSAKNKEGKWWGYGSFKENNYGKLQASFKVSALEELIAQAKSEGKEWVNLAAFENDKKPTQHYKAKQDGYQPSYADMDDTNPPF